VDCATTGSPRLGTAYQVDASRRMERPPANVDRNAGRPPRIANWNIGLQREITRGRTLLTSRMDSPAVIAAGFKAPYATFPMSSTLAQALRPYPQFQDS